MSAGITITETTMHSDATRHTAVPAVGGWSITWLPGRVLDRNAAITAMTIAQMVGDTGGMGLHDDPRWQLADALAGELGLSGASAVARCSELPA